MDISQIFSSLSAEDMKNLQDMASSLMSNTNASGNEQPSTRPTKQEQENALGGIDLNTLGNMASMLSAFSNNSNDPRCQLILSLKPLLSEERQRRADEAIRIIKLMDMLPMLRGTGIFNGSLFGG